MIYKNAGTYIGEYRFGGKTLYVNCTKRFRKNSISRFMWNPLSCTYHGGTVQAQMSEHRSWCEPDAADADDAADVRMLEALALCVGR